mmetsp:Transcript_14176/g.28025  ORF Transcript_14176/g.28025 Transcript_14176/m.28025 type:complete len:248 (-) Transcript_14176:158-901(-)
MQRSSGSRSSLSASKALQPSASAPSVLSLPSASPARRAPSLSSADAVSAVRRWQRTLLERVPSPGQPPGCDQLPSLYDARRSGPRPGTGLSRSQPPSSIGPSASVVAWFAQYRCGACGWIPNALDARFCCSCGKALSLPPLRAAVSETGASAAAVAVREAQELREAAAAASTASSNREVREHYMQRKETATPVSKLSTGTSSDLGKARRGLPPRPRGQGRDAKERLHWKDREAQVAVWLGDIRPRRP